MKKVKHTIFALILCLSVPVIAHAVDLEDGALYYSGGQNDKNVYSEIYDELTPFKDTEGDGKAWKVKATVTVGGNTYTSEFHYGTASISAERSFWSNENSFYQYKPLAIKEYTKDKWGERC